MYDFKNSFRNKYESTSLTCPVCRIQDEIDSQEHLYFCTTLNDEPNTDSYKNPFSTDIDKIQEAAKVTKDLIKRKEQLLKPKEPSK